MSLRLCPLPAAGLYIYAELTGICLHHEVSNAGTKVGKGANISYTATPHPQLSVLDRLCLRLKYRRQLLNKDFNHGLFPTEPAGHGQAERVWKRPVRGHFSAVTTPQDICGVSEGLALDTWTLFSTEMKRNCVKMSCDGPCVCQIRQL